MSSRSAADAPGRAVGLRGGYRLLAMPPILASIVLPLMLVFGMLQLVGVMSVPAN